MFFMPSSHAFFFLSVKTTTQTEPARFARHISSLTMYTHFSKHFMLNFATIKPIIYTQRHNYTIGYHFHVYSANSYKYRSGASTGDERAKRSEGSRSAARWSEATELSPKLVQNIVFLYLKRIV